VKKLRHPLPHRRRKYWFGGVAWRHLSHGPCARPAEERPVWLASWTRTCRRRPPGSRI